MALPQRHRRWIWAGRVLAVLILAGLIVYLWRVGLDTADKLASSFSAVLAVVAIVAPYLLPSPPAPPSPVRTGEARVVDSGAAEASGGGRAVTGIRRGRGAKSIHVVRSGDASAQGAGSEAITGFDEQP